MAGLGFNFPDLDGGARRLNIPYFVDPADPTKTKYFAIKRLVDFTTYDMKADTNGLVVSVLPFAVLHHCCTTTAPLLRHCLATRFA